MGRLFAGYLLGVVIGIGLGVLIGGVRRLRTAARPYVDFMRSLPPTALIPAVIVLFGIGSLGKVALIAFDARS